jgi:hypothetical protein
VGPAGGETGGPHCLAEVYQPLKGYQFFIFKELTWKLMRLEKTVKQKNKRTEKFRKVYIIHPTFS